MINKKMLILVVLFSVMLENIVAMDSNNGQQQQNQPISTPQVINDTTVPIFMVTANQNTRPNSHVNVKKWEVASLEPEQKSIIPLRLMTYRLNSHINEKEVIDLSQEQEQRGIVFVKGELPAVGRYYNYIPSNQLRELNNIRYVDRNASQKVNTIFYLSELKKIKSMAINDRNHQDGATYSFSYNQDSIYIDGKMYILNEKVSDLNFSEVCLCIDFYLCIYQIEQEAQSYNWVSKGLSPRDFLRLYEPEEALRLGLYTREYLCQKLQTPFIVADSELTWGEFWGEAFMGMEVSLDLARRIYGPILNKKLQKCLMQEVFGDESDNYDLMWWEFLCYKSITIASNLNLYTQKFLMQNVPNVIAEVNRYQNNDFASWMEFFAFNFDDEMGMNIIYASEKFLVQFLDQEMPRRLISKIYDSFFGKYKGITWREYVALCGKWMGLLSEHECAHVIKLKKLATLVFSENFLNSLISPAAAVEFQEYASCTWRDFFCLKKLKDAYALKLYTEDFFNKKVPQKLIESKDEIKRFSLNFREFLCLCNFDYANALKLYTKDLLKTVMSQIEFEENYREFSARSIASIKTIRFCDYFLSYKDGYIAYKLNALPKNFVKYKKEIDNRLTLKDYMRMWMTDAAQGIGLFIGDMLGKKIPASITDHFAQYREFTWQKYIDSVKNVEVK